MVSIALRDQLIKSIIFQFGEQCRESLSIDEKRREKREQAGKIRARTGSEKCDRLLWVPTRYGNRLLRRVNECGWKSALHKMAQDEVAEQLRRWTANPLCSARVVSNLTLIGQCLWKWAAIMSNDWHSYIPGHTNGQLFRYSIETNCSKNKTVRLLVRQALTRRGGRVVKVMNC